MFLAQSIKLLECLNAEQSYERYSILATFFDVFEMLRNVPKDQMESAVSQSFADYGKLHSLKDIEELLESCFAKHQPKQEGRILYMPMNENMEHHMLRESAKIEIENRILQLPVRTVSDHDKRPTSI